METLVVLISSDSSEKSVGFHVLRVIVFGDIPVIILVMPKVPTEVHIVPVDPLVAPERIPYHQYQSYHWFYPSCVLMTLRRTESLSLLSRDPRGMSLYPFLMLWFQRRLFPLVDFTVPILGPHRHSSPDFTSDSSSSGSSLISLSDTSSGSPSNSLSDTSSVHSLGCDASESSPDSSSKRSTDSSLLYARPSRKRCRSPTTLVPSSTLVSRSIAPTHYDFLPPRKRFRDSYSLEDSKEEHMEIGIADAEAVVDLGIGDEVGAHTEDGIGMGVEIVASDIKEDEEEFEAKASAGGTMEIAVDLLVTGGISESTRGDVPDIKDTLYDIVHYMSKVPLDRITKFKTAQRRLEAGHLMASGEREKELICKDRDDARRRLRRLESFVKRRLGFALSLVEWKSWRGGNNGNLNENGRGVMPVAHVYTYQDFVKCQPLNFKGTEGVVALRRWFENTKTVFHNNLMKLMTEVYYPRNKIQKMEIKLGNLTVKNNDLAAYTLGFQELTLLCSRMVPEEEDRIKRYVGGDANPGSNVVTGTFLLNNHYAYVLFDSGADRSFVSTTFSRMLDVILDTLESLVVLKFIIGMDWMANNHAVIVYDKKIVCIPFRDEILIVQGDMSDKGKKSTLSTISCMKTQKYMEKGCQRRHSCGPAKIESIRDWASPKTLTENHQFLGLDGYYRRFGTVLMQKGRAIAYVSCQLKIHEKKYTTHDLGLEIVVFALKIWRHWLYSTKCIVFTNHKSLQHILDQKELNIRQRRWLELLSDYDCKVCYHPGKANAQNEASKEENYGTEDLCGIIKKLESHRDEVLCLMEEVRYLVVIYVAVVVRDFYKKFYNSIGSVPNRCSVEYARLGGYYHSLGE
uniref:Putative reverse transcriptase domain-containing protein n=1 Tax=Tanacetum cinerariifolium TaxID=118510 RepID=A0A6L2LUK7_TANCI|nr:putative reverse transcriptase domain-containing protein [Tanacetum cinerariifolium]